MQTLPCTFTADNESSPAIGLIVLQSDETLEHELRQWLPKGYRLFHSRIPNSQQIDEQSLQAMKARLPDSVSLLPENTRFTVIAYGCTSASTLIGERAVTEAIQSVVGIDALVTNPISAIKAQLQHIKAKKIALLTPYAPDISAAMIANLEDSDYSIVHAGTFNETQDHRVARISRDSLLSAIKQLGAHRDIDALVASCTNLRTYELLNEASTSIGCTVISSNSALAWHIQQLASGITDRDSGHRDSRAEG
ncbi:MAG: hypothetical protein AB8B64_26995 [Granulosicoccus sp.]